MNRTIAFGLAIGVGFSAMTAGIIAASVVLSRTTKTAATPAVSQQEDIPRAIPLVGDETLLVRVKASPNDFLNKPIVATGGIEVGDYFNYGFRGSRDSHYNFRFTEILPGEEYGETCDLYLKKSTQTNALVERIIAGTKNGNGLLIRVKLARVHRGDDWSQFEIVDCQFVKPKRIGWESWSLVTSDR